MNIAKTQMATQMAEIRRKNVKEYFLECSKWHREWLKELAAEYKAKGEFPLMAMTLLPSYYDSVQDKEVAAFVGLLINDSETSYERVSELREMMGESPWKWFEERGFVRLSIGRKQNQRTGGVVNWRIARLFDRLWKECDVSVAMNLHGEERRFRNFRPIGVVVGEIARVQHCSKFDVLTYLTEDCGVGEYLYKLRLLLMVLGTEDGFGLGLWTVDPRELKSPLTRDVRTFLRTWFPDYQRYGNVDEAVSLFGMERDCDFFYAWLGYKELQKRNPKGCSEGATTYLSWYEHGTKRKPFRWREIIPR